MHTGLSMAVLVQVLLAVGIAASVIFYLVGYYEARRFFRPRPGSKASHEGKTSGPGITVLKPLKGLDAELYANLASFCEQAYATFQIVFGVADADDPAVAVVRQLRKAYPQVDMELIIDRRVYGTNYKLSNLHNMYRVAKHDLIVIADSDIRVGPDYLSRVAAPLQDPAVGLVTCLYRAVNIGGLPALLDTLFINTDFVPMVMVARVVEKPTYAFGATMALRRAMLDEIGGFLPLKDHLADDYHLGHRLAARGYRLALSDLVVETILAPGTWRGLLDHQLRWARTHRICRPFGYFGSIVTHGTLWATLNVLYSHFSPIACSVAVLVYALRMSVASRFCNRHLGARLTPAQAVFVPVKDLFVSAVWALAFLGDTVRWNAHEFRVMKDGRMVRVSPALPAEPTMVSYPGVQEERDQHPISL